MECSKDDGIPPHDYVIFSQSCQQTCSLSLAGLEEAGCYGVGGQAREAHMARICRQHLGADGGCYQETETFDPNASGKNTLPTM